MNYRVIKTLNENQPLTTAEWLDHYRFHPSEFENFIKFVETELAERDATIERLRRAGYELIRVLDNGDNLSNEDVANFRAELAGTK